MLIGPLHPDPNPVTSHGVWAVRAGVYPWGDPIWTPPDLLLTPIWAMLMSFRKGSSWYILPYTGIRGPKGVPLGCHPVPKGVGNGPKWGPF